MHGCSSGTTDSQPATYLCMGPHHAPALYHPTVKFPGIHWLSLWLAGLLFAGSVQRAPLVFEHVFTKHCVIYHLGISMFRRFHLWFLFCSGSTCLAFWDSLKFMHFGIDFSPLTISTSYFPVSLFSTKLPRTQQFLPQNKHFQNPSLRLQLTSHQFLWHPSCR